MIKNMQHVDRAMFLSLLLVIIFTPYSSAMIQAGLTFLLIGWLTKSFCAWKETPSLGFWKSFRFPATGIDWPLIALGVLIVVTIPMSHTPALSLKKFFSRFFQQIFLMYMTFQLVRTPKRLYIVMAMFLWTLVVVNFDIFVQYFSGQSFIFKSGLIEARITGPMDHPNDLASLLITLIPIILSLMMTRKYWMPVIFAPRFIKPVTWSTVVLLILMVIALGLSASRGGWLAFAVAILGFCFCLKDYKLLTRCAVGLVIFFVVFGFYCMNVRKDVFNDTTDKTNLAGLYSNPSDRASYWKVALDVFQKYPIYGCGYNAYVKTAEEDLKVPHQEYPHNSFLHVLAELGALGAFFFLALLFQLFISKGFEILKNISSQRNIYLLGCGIYFGLMAWFIHSLMDTPWESWQLSVLWWLLTGIFLALPAVAKQSKG